MQTASDSFYHVATHYAIISAALPPNLCPQKDESSILPIVSIIISLASVIGAYASVFLSKKLEVRFEKFKILFLENLKVFFKPIEDRIAEHPEDFVSNHLQTMISELADIELFLTKFGELFPVVEVEEIIKIKEHFTDNLFAAKESRLKEIQLDFSVFKSKVLLNLYKYAIKWKFKISTKFQDWY